MQNTLISINHKEKTHILDNHFSRLLFLATFLLFFYLMWVSPLCSDDYEFLGLYLPKFSNVLSYVLYYGNGRLLGNMGVVYLVRSRFLSAFVRAFIISSVIVLLPYSLECKSKAAYIVSALLFVGMLPKLFGEVFSWDSGFNNYVPPVWLTILIVLIIQKNNHKQKLPVLKLVWLFVIVILGISSQLFVEHTTIINLILAVYYNYEAYKKNKYSKLFCSGWLVSTIVGAAVMISVPRMFYLEVNRQTGYRSMNIGGIKEIIVSCKNNGFRLFNLIEQNYLIFIALLLIGITLLIRNRQKCNLKLMRILMSLYLVSGAYIIVDNLSTQAFWYGRLASGKYFFSFISVSFLIMAFIATIYITCQKTLLRKIIIIVIFAVFSLLPLLIVSPIAMRVVFQFYVMISAVIIICTDYLVSELKGKEDAITEVGKIILGVQFLCIALTYFNILWLDCTRTNFIESQVDQNVSEIEVFKIPYEYVFWDGTWMFEQYYYNQEKGDIDFIGVEIDEWMGENFLDE